MKEPAMRRMTPGVRNLITDVPGLLVGNAADAAVKTGVTVVTAARPFLAAVHVMGGAPGTRETDLLAPENTVETVDALVLSGGSAFGLDAASGVMAGLRVAGRGFLAAGVRVPIVPAAILFDLTNGGAKDWVESPYPALGRAALASASEAFALGTEGAGHGASVAEMKGGLGSASAVLASGVTVGALAAVNAVGGVCDGSGRFWAAPFEIGGEFGGRGAPEAGEVPEFPVTKLAPGAHTTIAVVATDAALTKAGAKRMAVAAHDGLARAIVPAHTPLDGDLVFGVATGDRPLADPVREAAVIGHAAAVCLSRAIARAVYHARSAPGDALPSWWERFGG
jgi:L-aminopeptidase/D-esterase-like protein